MQLVPYLNFDGQAESAMRFYADALGGTLTELHRFSMMPPGPDGPLPPELASRVMHVGLTVGGAQVVMASDTLPGMGPAHVVGTHASISVHPDSRADADRIFASLAEGGTVTMPLADQFWGDYFGSVTDKFGVQWMINFNEQGA